MEKLRQKQAEKEKNKSKSKASLIESQNHKTNVDIKAHSKHNLKNNFDFGAGSYVSNTFEYESGLNNVLPSGVQNALDSIQQERWIAYFPVSSLQ